jgi:hypothetical protein
LELSGHAAGGAFRDLHLVFRGLIVQRTFH